MIRKLIALFALQVNFLILCTIGFLVELHTEVADLTGETSIPWVHFVLFFVFLLFALGIIYLGFIAEEKAPCPLVVDTSEQESGLYGVKGLNNPK